MNKTVILLLLFTSSLAHGKRSDLLEKIVGGENTTISEFPWQGSFQIINHHLCGCIVVSSQYVLTAAHCLINWKLYFKDYMQIIVGTTFYNSGGKIYSIQDVIIHPKYKNGSSDYDIAAVRVWGEIEFSECVKPVKIPKSAFYVNEGIIGTATGWGTTEERAIVRKASIQLRKVNVIIGSMAKCRDQYDGVLNITPRMFCAGDPRGGKDSCQGDSGGPLTVDQCLSGIVSTGSGCGRSAFYGIYTNVYDVRDFIIAIIGEDELLYC